ncbi:O-Antigen ligase [Rubripirellula obstinata]|uniref:O-Antigen ligase n=1 Tax=Rubripirellula obstinata TaxID=406547 RepID=A0A5B1CGZ0_9BACT|nr:O-antigen ligase family protein [Rubripirellula obstinata]KAA1259009.1 O-Antigen ligase [Rubripirellula obstinata]
MAFRILHPLIAALFAFGPLFFAMFANSVVAQAYLGSAIALSSLIILERVFNRSLPTWTLFLLMAASVVMICYWALLLASGSGVDSADTFKVLGRLSIMPLVLCAAGLIDWRRPSVIRCVSITAIVLLSLFTLVHLNNGMTTGLIFLELHSNFLGIIGGFAIIFAFYFRRIGRSSILNILLAAVGLIACVCSVSRTSYAVVILFFGIYFIYCLIGVRPITALPAVVLTIAAAITLSLSWPNWIEHPTVQRASEVSMEHLGKRLGGGRALMWQKGKMRFEKNPWIGTGTEAHADWTVIKKNGEVLKLSIHNYYYAVLHESGIIGLAIITAYIMAITWVLSTGHNMDSMTLGIAFLLVLLIHQITEVSLTTGSFMVGIAMWTGLGAMLSGSRSIPVDPRRAVSLW